MDNVDLKNKELINDTKSIKTSDDTELLKLFKMYQEMYDESDNYINITELMKLTNVGIPLTDLTFSKTKMSNEHCICVRHTCIKRKPFNLNKNKELNGHQYNSNQYNSNQHNSKAKFFLNEDDLNSSFDSRKDYQFNSNSYDKYSNGRNSLSSDKSDESTKNNQQLSSSFQSSKSKKNSFNSKLRLYNSNEKSNNYFSINNNIYKSENNLDNQLFYSTSTLSRNGRKMMIKSNSFNNIINNYKSNGIYRSNTENYYSINTNSQFTNNQLEIPKLINQQQLKQQKSQSTKLITEFSSIIYLINPYDARINKFETDYVKIAILNPIRTFIAVATNYTVHVLSTKSCQVIATTHLDENVEFICWLNPLIIAIITTKTVYHWDLKNNSNQPYIVFFKSPKMFNCEIINYEANDQMDWYALSCLYLEEDGKTITGLVQIHHLNEQTKLNGYETELDSNNNCCFQQCIEAHSVSFARIKFNENNVESTTLIAIKKTSSNTIKLYIIELGPLNPKNNLLIARTEILRFNDNVNGYQFDIPLHNVICLKLSLIYIISKYGRLIIADLQTGQQISSNIISEDVIISAKLDISDNQSLICINRVGQVLLIEIDFINLLKQFTNDDKLKKIGKRIKFALNDVNDEVTRL